MTRLDLQTELLRKNLAVLLVHHHLVASVLAPTIHPPLGKKYVGVVEVVALDGQKLIQGHIAAVRPPVNVCLCLV